jgi:hypothetical protein
LPRKKALRQPCIAIVKGEAISERDLIRHSFAHQPCGRLVAQTTLLTLTRSASVSCLAKAVEGDREDRITTEYPYAICGNEPAVI